MACTTNPNIGLRRTGGPVDYLSLPVDPAFGIPIDGGCWVYYDTATGYVRPFSSTDDLDDVLDSPIKGVVEHYVRPGCTKQVVVWLCGLFSFKLSTAAPVEGGITMFTPLEVGGVVSNEQFVITTDAGLALMTAIEHRPCLCDDCYTDPCVTAEAAASVSPSDSIIPTGDTNYAIAKFCNVGALVAEIR